MERESECTCDIGEDIEYDKCDTRAGLGGSKRLYWVGKSENKLPFPVKHSYTRDSLSLSRPPGASRSK